MANRVSLDFLNDASAERFVAALDGIFEHAPWVAERASAARPFATVAALHDGLMEVVLTSAAEKQIQFLRLHPDLAGKAARAGAIAAASVSEQAGLGLDRLSDEEFSNFERLNAAYREKFGFPFVICVRRQTRDTVLRSFAARLELTVDQERAAALNEIGHITRLRLVERVEGPGVPAVNGRLSTHVLDTLHGRSAAGVRIELFEVGRHARARLADVITNADGRTDAPLMHGAPLRIGTYELLFHIGAYFRARGVSLPDQPFLDEVPLRFGISDPEGHYHVPLVASAWSYSTYRGS